MENIKSRNLYLPILHKTKFFQHQGTHHSMSQIEGSKGEGNDLLRLIQLKKAQLYKNAQDDDSDYSSDNQNYNLNNRTEQTDQVQTFQRSKVLSYDNVKIHSFQQKLKTDIEEKYDNEQPINTQIKQRNFRVRTQHNQNCSKSTNNASQISKKVKHSPKQHTKLFIKFLKPKEMSRQLSKIIPSIPTKMKQRNQKTLKEVVQFLQEYNPFFIKMDRIVATCLLKVCKIVKRGKRQTIYERQTPSSKFYIILSGRVKISHKQIDLKKICVPGQTILEETWVCINEIKKVFPSLEKARSVGESYLLQVPLEKLQKVKEQLIRFGFKTQYHEIEALIKRNYIVKNAIRIQKNKF